MTGKMPVASLLLDGSPIATMGPVLRGLKAPITTNSNGDPMISGPGEPEVHVPSVPGETRNGIVASFRGAVPFNVQVASELYWGGKKDYYRLDQDFGPLRLPYPRMWMEWNIPARGYFQGRKYDHGETKASCACYLYEQDGPTDVPLAEKIITAQFLAHTTGVRMRSTTDQRPVLVNDVALAFAVDHDGRYVGNSLVEMLPDDAPDGDPITEVLIGEAKSNLYICCLALNLINCRNVRHEQAGTIPFKRSGTDKRRGVEPIKYRTIILPGMTVERGYTSRKQREANAAVLRQHMVRGHLKHFTKERPLLGKHVGTYWWNPTVRGNPERGKVIQDYKIGEQE